MHGEVWLEGDWNTDYLKIGDNKYGNRKVLKLIVDTMSRHGYTQLIEEGTHEENGKLSCINLIFANNKMKVTGPGDKRVGTHHNLVYVNRESGYTMRINEVRKRVMGNFTEEGLK